MKTRIVIAKGWKTIKVYDFLLPMSKGDVVEYEGVEYTVIRCFLEIKQEHELKINLQEPDQFVILLK